MTGTGTGLGLWEHFGGLDDPRQACKVVYPLKEILLVVLCGILCGCDDFVEMAAWGREHLGFLREFESFARGVPSHDTLTDLINALDPDVFEDCFSAWVATLGDGEADLIALDGKTVRGSGDRRRGRRALHVVSAWASRQRLVLAQEAVANKSNEITAFPRLLERVLLPGCLVTIDAAGCQRALAEQVVAAKADYLLAIKANQRGLHGRIKRTVEERRSVGDFGLATLETTDGGHDRIEVRRHFVLSDPAWLQKGYDWPGLAAVGLVEAEIERNGKTTTTQRFFLLSKPMTPQLFAAAVRGHWGIENNVHWVLDVVFRDDHARLRNRYGTRNMSLIKRIAINKLKAIADRNSLKVRRKLAGWSTAYLRPLLQSPI